MSEEIKNDGQEIKNKIKETMHPGNNLFVLALMMLKAAFFDYIRDTLMFLKRLFVAIFSPWLAARSGTVYNELLLMFLEETKKHKYKFMYPPVEAMGHLISELKTPGKKNLNSKISKNIKERYPMYWIVLLIAPLYIKDKELEYTDEIYKQISEYKESFEKEGDDKIDLETITDVMKAVALFNSLGMEEEQC